MATTPEEFFAEGLMEPSPPSPSVFLDLNPMPDSNTADKGQLSHDDLLLPNISCMHMEDDIDGKLLCQYSDHPALLQAQQPFVRILSSPPISAKNDDAANKGNMDQADDLLLVSSGDKSTLSLAFSDGEYVVGEFLKGMEDANRFLPSDNSFIKGHQMNQMFIRSKRKHLEEEVGRTSKIMMTTTEVPEETGIHEMLDDMMTGGDEALIRDMEKLRTAMSNKEEKKKRRKGSSKVTRDMVDLSTLLIRCAQAVDRSNYLIGGELLNQIKQHASTTGDAMQRLAQCFSKGLQARLMGTGKQLWNLLIADRPSAMEFLKAYNLYMSACYFNKVAHIFSALTIAQVMKGKSRLHIVGYGIHGAFQWAGLIRWLAKREGGPPLGMKITTICCSHPESFPVQWIEEQRYRLSKYASELGLPFVFEVVTAEREKVCIQNLNVDADEVLVVSDLFNLSTLKDESIFFDSPNPRDTVLSNIKKMRPNVFIQSVLNCSNGSCFLSRFREKLFYYSALFDMLDAIVPRESEPRSVLEQELLGRYVLNAIACEGIDLAQHPEKYRQWQSRNQRAGLRQLPLRPVVVNVLKDKVKKHHHKDLLLSEEGQWLLQGWKGRVLFAHSTWVVEDGSSE
ncbi:hypothetical protein SEVIR_7G120200v4 [Setaria viridis]|uniref:Uncharacterized protein n=1 Tax=Setaria viridis TaxID=4556 RepID=A0A4U6TPG7_SETVI|nr:scarecrow-like protein 9 [Setaria viridis]TKW04600.1 hypothetical protein SEVIR_7G120200v2 [Setaria viridis]